jgi:hypothetical protein
MTHGICCLDDCEKPASRRGLCNMHADRLRRHGSAHTVLKAGNGEALSVFLSLVQSETDEHVVWPMGYDHWGYGQLRWEGRVRKTHQLSLELRQPRPEGTGALHAPGCPKGCMNYRHLRWGTPAENAADKLLDGTDRRGERCPTVKLNQNQVRDIRRRYSAGGITMKQLAEEYGMTQGGIGSITRRITWAWLD